MAKNRGGSYFRLILIFILISIIAVFVCIKLYNSDIAWVKQLLSKN